MKRYIIHSIILFVLGGLMGSVHGQKQGDVIADFTLDADDGTTWQLSKDFTEDKLVIYFYPAAMTGGCTAQACGYRDNMNEFEEKSTQVIAISGDAVKNLSVFKRTYNLNFPLLSDSEGKVAKLLGVPTGKGGVITRTIDGKEVALERNVTTSRWTFVLNNKRELIHIISDVKAKEDSKAILNYISELD